MFKKIIESLYRKYCHPDIVSMTREQLKSFNQPVDIEALSSDDRQRYYAEALNLQKNEILQNILNGLVKDVSDTIIYNSSNIPIQLTHAELDRFTLNGVSLVSERIDQYASMFKEDEGDFDKHAII